MQMPNWMPEPGSPLDRVATFLMANLLWLTFAVLIVTLPAATAGLFAVFAPWVRGRDTEFFSVFFGTMRRQWLKSSVIFIADVIIGFIVLTNFRALEMMGLETPVRLVMTSINAFVIVAILLTNLYIWPLLVLFDLPLRRLINVAVRMGLGHPFWSLLTLGLALLPLVLALFLPALLLILVGFSTVALIINWGTWRIIQKYATPEELAELDQP